MLHERLVVQRDPADLLEGHAVAEEHVELPDRTEGGGLGRRKGGDELIPGRRLGGLAPTFESLREAGHDLRLTIRHFGGFGQQLVQRTRLLIRSLGEATGDELGHLRDPADVGAVGQFGERQLADSRPDEQREVMVGRVLVVTQQVLGDERAHGRGEVRKRRRQGEAHALAVRGRRQLQDRILLLVAVRDEPGMVRVLGQGIVPPHQRLGEFAFDQAGQDIGALLGEEGGGRVMGAVSIGKGLRPRLGRGHRTQGRVRVEREDRVGLGDKLLPRGQGRRQVDAPPGALAEFPAGHADQPFVRAALQVDELGRGRLGEVDAGRLGFAMGDLEDPAGSAVDAVLVVALADVAPVEDRDGAVRALAQLDPAEPRVVGFEDVRLVLHDQRAALPLDGFDVHATTVEVEGHQLVPELRRPVLAPVNHHAHVRVTAAQGLGPAAAAIRIVPLLARVPMVVVRLLVDELVHERVRILAVHALEVGAVDTLPTMPDHRVDEEQLVVLGPIGAPRVRRAVAIRLEDLRHRVVTPEPARGRLTLLLRDARHIDPRGAGDAHASVEPTVRTPLESVGERMAAGGRRAETIEHHLGRARGLVTVHRDEEQVRRAHRPHPAETALDAREHLHVVGEHRALIELPVVIGVLEDHDAILQLQVEAFLAVRVGVVLRHPESAALIPAERDGLAHIWLGGEERGPEARRQMELGQGVGRRERRDRLRLVIARLREGRRPQVQGGEQSGEADIHRGGECRPDWGRPGLSPPRRRPAFRIRGGSESRRRSRRSARASRRRWAR